MKELSFEKMETVHGGGSCAYAIAYGTASIWMIGIGMAFPIAGAAFAVGTLVVSAMGYGPDMTACG